MSSFSAADHAYMARALQLARQGLYTTHPNPRVGCVIVKKGHIIGEGWHQRTGQPHAEVYALQQAGAAAKDADVYVTLEPCAHIGRTPPCANALIAAGVKRVVAAMIDPNPLVAGQGLTRLQAAGIHTASGLLEAEARLLNIGFISRVERGRPWVRLKMAQSIDGRTAMASGESVWITGESARRDVQLWRAQSSAILTGINTILMDKPRLDVRLSATELGITGEVRQPLRVILDSQLRFPVDAPLLKIGGAVRIYTCNQDAIKMATLAEQGVSVRVFAGEQLDLQQVMQALGEEGINEVHVEAGATLGGALIEEDLIDELLLYIAPHLMGSSARPLVELPLSRMSERRPLQIMDVRAVGTDWRVLARFQKGN